jgi:hypothetical protein
MSKRIALGKGEGFMGFGVERDIISGCKPEGFQKESKLFKTPSD